MEGLDSLARLQQLRLWLDRLYDLLQERERELQKQELELQEQERELQERLFPGAQRALLEGLVATWWLKRKSGIEIDASTRGLALPLSTMESDTIESIIYICREVYGAKTDASTETMLKQRQCTRSRP